MNRAIKRIFVSVLLLFTFGIALYLRLYGSDWALKDKTASPHPDERHYENCAGTLRPQWLTNEEKELPLREQIEILYEKNLKINPGPYTRGTPGLRPENYNYGTFPLHLYLLYRAYLVQHSGIEGEWTFLTFTDWFSWIILFFILLLGVKLFRAVSRDLSNDSHRLPAVNPIQQTNLTDADSPPMEDAKPVKKKLPLFADERKLAFLFPCLLIPFVGLLLTIFLPQILNNFSDYDPRTTSILLIGRIITAWAGALTVLVVYLIGRDAYNRLTGLIAAFMMTTAMLHVQCSHYATVDVLIGFWSTLAIYCFLKISQKPCLIWYLFGAIFTGFAIGTKWSGITLPGILFLAHASATWGDERTGKLGRWIQTIWLIPLALVLMHFFKAAGSMNPTFDITLAVFRDFYLQYWQLICVLIAIVFILSLIALIIRRYQCGREVGLFRPAFRIYLPWLWLLIAVPVGFTALLFAEPMAYFDAHYFAEHLVYQSSLNATGTIPVVYTQQYLNASPIFYSFDNLFYPSLDSLTAFFVVAGCLYAFFRIFFYRANADFILCAWVIPSFILYSTFSSKFPRYMLAILPVMMVLGGRLISDLARLQPHLFNPQIGRVSVAWKRTAKHFGIVGGAAALLAGLIYGWAYVGIYDAPHTLVTAGNLLRPKAMEGKKITQNNWDEGLYGIHIEWDTRIGIHDNPNADKNASERAGYLAQKLAENDYIVFPSKRGYGTTLHNPDRFPLTNQFLKAFFAEQLGFRVAKVITNPPKFLWWEFRVDEEDETARIYDHPKVVIFEKIKQFNTQELKNLILNPPEWVNRITEKEILTLRDGHPVFMRHPSHPILTWWFVVQILGLIAFLFLFPLCSRLPDRGYGISKIVGIALFSWICWMLASTKILLFSRMQPIIVFLLLVMVAGFIWIRYKDSLRLFLREKWPLIVGMEGLYLLLWAIFLIIRAYHPAAYEGEKPMNYSFINAAYRAETFPPEDPWISGFPINYYYYGQAMFSIIGRFADIPPEYLFNLAGTSATALAGLGIFSLTYALCRKSWISLLAVYLGVFCSHIYSYFCLLKYVFYKNNSDPVWLDYLTGIYTSVKLMVYALFTYLGIASTHMIEEVSAIDFHGVFWPARTNIFYGAVANEFPYWTHLFLDFHAHMLVIPISLAFLTLLLAYFIRPRANMGILSAGGFTFFLALLMGTVICSNTWDFPALLISLLLITLIKFQRESEWMKTKNVGIRRFSVEGLQDLVRFPIVPIAAALVFSYLFMLPFHNSFVARVTGIGFMSEGNSPLTTYLIFWAQLIVPILFGLILFIAVRPDSKLSIPRILSFAFFFIFVLVIALRVTTYVQTMLQQNPGYFHGWFVAPHNSGPPTNYSVVGLLLPFLTVLFFALWKRDRKAEHLFALFIGFLGMGLSLGIEFFYVKEGWSPPLHRFNTAFKFNIQIWHYYSIFAAISIAFVWKTLRDVGKQIGNPFTPVARSVFLLCVLPFFLATVPFTVLAPAMVTLSAGAKGRDARGEVPTLNGLGWLRHENYNAYAAVQWFNRFVDGSPHIVELADVDYYQNSRFSSNTGLPTILGWPHHVGERLHAEEKAPRLRDVDRIYLSNDKKEVMELLGKYQVEYLVFSALELHKQRERQQPPYGPNSLARFEQWGDVFRLAYRLGDTSIFKIDKCLNQAYGLRTESKIEEAKPPAERPPEPGISIFRSGPGSGNGQFREARGFIQDASGAFFVADTFNHRIQVFKPNGEFAWKTGEKGALEGQFNEPNDITIDPESGNIFVADTWNHRIVLLDAKGSFMGSAAMGFFGPRGIVYHPQRQLIYMSDTGNHQIVVMTPTGKLLQRWGKAGGGSEDTNFREPAGIAVLPDENLVIADSINRRIKIYTSQGAPVKLWPFQTTRIEEGGIEIHLACSPEGVIYATDPREPSVHAYTVDGELIEKITQDVTGQKLIRPVGILMTSNEHVFVSDLGLNRILRVK
jgi:YYY domain-containing protein